MEKYGLMYWGYDPDDKSATRLLYKDVLASQEMVNTMLTSDKPFYKFIIGDGEDFILAKDCIHSLTRVIDWEVR